MKMVKVISCLFTILQIVVFINVNAQNRNFYLDTWREKTYQKPTQGIQVSLEKGKSGNLVTVFVTDSLAPVLPVQSGLNTTFRSGTDMYKKRLANYRESGMGSYRFPAGSGSNIYFWDGKIPDKFLIHLTPIDGTVSGSLNIEEFVAFCDSLDAEATFVVNYFYARYGFTPEGTRESRVKQAAEYAAGFVNYVNRVLRAGVRNWEIGNECYGKWEEGYDVNGSIVTGKEYGEDFRVFAEKMKAVDPSIKVGAVMYPKDDNWNDQVMKEVKNHADFLVVHNYFTLENEATIQNILAGTSQIDDIKKQMEGCILRNTVFPADHYPVAFTEYNCRGPHTTTFVNALFTAEVLGRIVENKYGLATRWVGEWPWKTGTHGLFAVDDPDQVNYSFRQAYPVYHYFDKASGDFLLKSASENEQIKVFATAFGDGKKGLMVINSSGVEQSFNLNFSDNQNLGECWYYEIYANSTDETDKKFYVNGMTSVTKGGGPASLEGINPYQSDFNSETVFKVKKYSVTFFVFDTSLNTGSSIRLKKPGLSLFPNPVKTLMQINNCDDCSWADIFSINGEKVYSSAFNKVLDVSCLNSGNYLLRAYGRIFSGSAIFVKQ